MGAITLGKGDLVADYADAVDRAVSAAMHEPPEHLLRAMFTAVYSYKESNDTGELVRFANAAVSTMAVHAHPDYERGVSSSETPARRGRSLDEIFGRTG